MPQPPPAGLNTSTVSGPPPRHHCTTNHPSTTSMELVTATAASAPALDAHRVASLVRQLAEARLEAQQLKMALQQKEQELAAAAAAATEDATQASGDRALSSPRGRKKRHSKVATPSSSTRSTSSSVSTASSPTSASRPEVSSGDTGADPANTNHHNVSDRNGRLTLHKGHNASAERHQKEKRDDMHQQKRFSNHSHHCRDAAHRKRRDRHDDYRRKYASLRLRYEKLRLRREQELGEIRYLVDMISLEQEQMRLQHKQKELLRAIGDKVAPSHDETTTGDHITGPPSTGILPPMPVGTAAGVVASMPPPAMAVVNSVSNSHDVRPRERQSTIESHVAGPARASAEALPQTPVIPESLDVTRISQAAPATDQSPPKANELPAPPAVVNALPASPEEKQRTALPSPQPFHSSHLSATGAPTSAASVPSPEQLQRGTSAAPLHNTAPSSTEAQRLQEEVSLWKDQCLRLLLAASLPQAPLPQAPWQLPPARPQVSDISVDSLPPPPDLTRQALRPPPLTATVAPDAVPKGLFLGVPETSLNNPYALFYSNRPPPPPPSHVTRSHTEGAKANHSAFPEDPGHHPVGATWGVTGNALPPYVYDPSYPPYATSESILDMYAQRARGSGRDSARVTHPPKVSPRTETSSASTASSSHVRRTSPSQATASSAAPSTTTTTDSRRAAPQNRAELERDIARHDQLLAAISKLQHAAAEHTARKPM